MNKKIDIQLLEKTIDDLKNNPNACTLINGTASSKEVTIPESCPDTQLKTFIKYLYDNKFLDQNYLDNFEKIRDKEVKNYTYSETITALTKIIRGDRFISGEIYSCFKSGLLLEIIEKLKNLITSNQITEEKQTTSSTENLINYKLHAEQLDIPILEGFQIEEIDNPRTILFAIGKEYIEQITSDGFVGKGEFEERINYIIDCTKVFMRDNKCENVDDSFTFYEDYNNGIFDFKLYFQDMIIPLVNEIRIVRSLNAFFIEPKMKDFYQVTLSASPIVLSTNEPKKIDSEYDKVSSNLDILMKKILSNLKYKK